MSKEYSFSVMPSVSISRSRFARKSQHKTSFNLGSIVPIYLDEVLPGDTMSFDFAGLVRMSQPIAPIMDNIYIDYFAFFVPNRLVWDHWKEFMGENSASAGIPSTTYSIPMMEASGTGGTSATSTNLAGYFGLPVGVACSDRISALPFRAYYLIYNEWFRDQNLIAPVAVNKTDNPGCIVGYTGLGSPNLAIAAKLSDYFTRSLPYAQKGQPVSIPMGTSAPLSATNVYDIKNLGLNTDGVVKFGVKGESQSNTTAVPYFAISGTNQSAGILSMDHASYSAYDDMGSVNQTNLVVDLTNATAATINQLRYAFQLQKFLEKDALYGSRYWEILAAHFGIKAPDASLQRPEYLGGFRQRVNIDQVLSTAGYDDTSGQEVGKPGANSVSGFKNSLFTKSFTEHGYVFVLAVARHDQTYAQGVNRMWTRSSRYDFYFPVFANLGAQDVKLCEIYAAGSNAFTTVFGYQEAWAEYRYKPSIATGLLNPNVSGSLDYWTLTNKFSASPTLGKTFIEQDRNNLARALATGNTGPDFIADFYFENICVRPMPMYSIPGLIDHH